MKIFVTLMVLFATSWLTDAVEPTTSCGNWISYDPKSLPKAPVGKAFQVGAGFDGYQGYVGTASTTACGSEEIMPARISPIGGDPTKAGGYMVCNTSNIFSNVNTKYLDVASKVAWKSINHTQLASINNTLILTSGSFQYGFARYNGSVRPVLGKVYIAGGDTAAGAFYFGPYDANTTKTYEILTCTP